MSASIFFDECLKDGGLNGGSYRGNVSLMRIKKLKLLFNSEKQYVSATGEMYFQYSFMK